MKYNICVKDQLTGYALMYITTISMSKIYVVLLLVVP